MCCLSKEEVLRGHRALLEIEDLIDKNDLCFQEEETMVLTWTMYIVLVAPLLYIIAGLLFK